MRNPTQLKKDKYGAFLTPSFKATIIPYGSKLAIKKKVKSKQNIPPKKCCSWCEL